jgi:short-subunit dehydrogenase involved in D-alanine esterification of teichoic acids
LSYALRLPVGFRLARSISARSSWARQGDKVLVTGRRPGPIEETIAEHANIAGLVADAASAEDAKRTIAKAVDTWGRVDALVKYHDMINAFPADRTDQPFCISVLPR